MRGQMTASLCLPCKLTPVLLPMLPMLLAVLWLLQVLKPLLLPMLLVMLWLLQVMKVMHCQR